MTISSHSLPLSRLSLYCDGGARGNPGPAAIGFVVKDSPGHLLYQHSEFIGYATNNVAEYRAVIAALQWLVKSKITIHYPLSTIHFYLDSSLLVNQLNGKFKIKHASLKQLYTQTLLLIRQLNYPVTFTLIPRELNHVADSLVNSALDSHLFRS